MPIDPQMALEGQYFLKRNPLFGSLDDVFLSRLVQSFKPLLLEKDATLFREGEPGDGLYLIKSGRVRINSRTEKGDDRTISYRGRGDALGELSIITGEPHPFSVILDTPCEFLVLSKKDFDSVLDTSPAVGLQLSRALYRRLGVSLHTPMEKPRQPLLAALLPGLPHEATLLFTVNLAISLVEQTRRRVILLDITPRSGDMMRALRLNVPLPTENTLHEDDLLNIHRLHQITAIHPSGLEILSIPPATLKGRLLPAAASLFSVLKDHYDTTLVVAPVEKDPLTQLLLKEASQILIATWDQAPELALEAQAQMAENMGSVTTPVTRVHLHHPSTTILEKADFRVPWLEAFHQPFRASGSPYLAIDQAGSAIAGLDRIARALGKLRVGLAMGSGAAYGYTLIGLLKVFEREGIPIDLAAGTSMGALLGSFFCAGNSPARIEEIAHTITKRWLWENILGDLTLPHSGFLVGHTLSRFLESVLGTTEFHQLPIPFAAVATDIRSGHEVALQEGRVADAVRASTSLPILFAPFLHKGRYLVDGGLVNPVPASVVSNMGADILISVNLTAKPSVRRGLGRYRKTFLLEPRSPRMTEVFFKMIYTMQYEIAQARTEFAHVAIAPDTREFLWTDFHRAAEIIKVGEAAAEEAIPKIKSLLPFFSDYCRVPLGIQLRAY